MHIFRLIGVFTLPETLWVSSCLCMTPTHKKYPVCSDWSAHTCLNQRLQSALWCFQLPVLRLHFCCEYRHTICKYVTRWCSVMSQSPRIRGGATWQGFSGVAVSMGERSCWSWLIFYMQKNPHNTLKERKDIIIGLIQTSKSFATEETLRRRTSPQKSRLQVHLNYPNSKLICGLRVT